MLVAVVCYLVSLSAKNTYCYTYMMAIKERASWHFNEISRDVMEEKKQTAECDKGHARKTNQQQQQAIGVNLHCRETQQRKKESKVIIKSI